MKHKEAGMQKLATLKQTIKTPFKDVLPPLKQSEQEALAADIKANGVLHPVVIDEYGNILDGHHRYAIDHNAPTRVVSGLSPDEKVAYTIRANLARRNLSSDQIKEVAKQQKRIATDLREADPKKWTQKSVGALLGVARNTVSVWFSTNVNDDNTTKKPTPDARVKLNAAAKEAVAVRVEAGESQEQIAADFGVCQKTVSNILKTVERANAIKAQREAIEAGNVQLPAGVFEVIVMDPPWAYGREYDPDGSRVANPYPEMNQQQLLQMQPPFAGDCVLFLWTTHQFLWDAGDLMRHWGFTYKATLVWDKEKMGMGVWLRMQCEFCLVGIKGKPAWDNTKHRDIVREARREHSRKPEAFYEIVEDITIGRKLDFFSRQQRTGWDTYGNDLEKF